MLINIQFLRFVAATLVLLYHVSHRIQATGIDQGSFFRAFEAIGFAGVDIFFFISGFIMFHTTTQARGMDSSTEFIKRRVARIYSGYWPFFVLSLLILPWAIPAYFENVNLVASLFLWPVPLNDLLLQVSWTLTYEMYFYAVFALLLFFSRQHRTMLIGFLFVGVVTYNLYKHFVLHGFSADNMYFYSFANQFLLSPLMAEFLAGALLAALPLHAGSRALAWLLLVLGIAGFALAGWVNLWIFDGRIEQGYHLIARVVAFGLPSGLLIAGLVKLEKLGYRAAKNFSMLTGGASYALYLSHTLFLDATSKLGLEALMSQYPAQLVKITYLVYAAIIVACSVAWFRTAEQPLHRWFKRALRVRSRR